jgi:hypothetical protein
MQLLLAEGKLSEAEALLARAQAERVQPDNHMCGSILLLLLRQGRLADARDHYAEMKKVGGEARLGVLVCHICCSVHRGQWPARFLGGGGGVTVLRSPP